MAKKQGHRKAGRPAIGGPRIYANLTERLMAIVVQVSKDLEVSQADVVRRCVENALLPSILRGMLEDAVRGRDAEGLLRAAAAAKASETKAVQFLAEIRYQKARIDKALEILAGAVQPEEVTRNWAEIRDLKIRELTA